MFAEIYDYLANWKFITVFISINIVLLVYHLRNVVNCLQSQATGKTKTVLVTGCDTGFGYKTSLQLNASKVKVFSGCLTKEGVKRLQDDPAFRGYAFLMDVTNIGDIEIAYELIKTDVGDDGLWGVVNNAGILQPGLIEWQATEDMQKAMNVNLWGVVNVTKAMLPLIKKTKGRIVNVVSMAGRVLLPNCTAYTMSKFACQAFSDGLRYEMKAWDVSVHIIEPGMFNTAIVTNRGVLWNEAWRKVPSDTKEAYGEGYFEELLEAEKYLLNMLPANDIKKVPDAICHALLSSNPKIRYAVGYDTILYMTMAVLPSYIQDFVTGLYAKTIIPKAMKQEKNLPRVLRSDEDVNVKTD